MLLHACISFTRCKNDGIATNSKYVHDAPVKTHIHSPSIILSLQYRGLLNKGASSDQQLFMVGNHSTSSERP